MTYTGKLGVGVLTGDRSRPIAVAAKLPLVRLEEQRLDDRVAQSRALDRGVGQVRRRQRLELQAQLRLPLRPAAGRELVDLLGFRRCGYLVSGFGAGFKVMCGSR